MVGCSRQRQRHKNAKGFLLPDRLPVIGQVSTTTCHVITLAGGFFTHSFYRQYERCGRDPKVHNKVDPRLEISASFHLASCDNAEDIENLPYAPEEPL